MKRLLITIAAICILMLQLPVYADVVNLNSAEALAVPTAQKVSWYISRINAKDSTCVVKFLWLDAGGTTIHIGSGRAGVQTFYCVNHLTDSVPTVTIDECIDVGDPDPCCTGPSEGTCDAPRQIDNNECVAKGEPYSCCTAPTEGICSCFSDTFGKSVTNWSGIVGVGLRNLLFQQWKKVYLTGTNDGVFE